jgi:hypothetical protein
MDSWKEKFVVLRWSASMSAHTLNMMISTERVTCTNVVQGATDGQRFILVRSVSD